MESLWPKTPTRKQLREFGVAVGGALMVVGGILLWRHPAWHAQWYAWIAGAALMLLGAVAPPLLAPLYKPWMAFATGLGIVTTSLLLSVLYLLVLPLFGLFARLTGKDSLERAWAPGTQRTYWKPHERIDVPDRHLRPF